MNIADLNPVELIDQFRAKARAWWSVYQGWQNAEARFKGTALEGQYRALMNDGLAVRAAIEKATGAIDSVKALYDQAKAAVGFGGATPMGLGFLPFVMPVAIATTIVLSWRAIDAWMMNAQALRAAAEAQSKGVDLATRLAAAGTPPAEIARIMAGTQVTATAAPKPLLEQAKTVLIWGVVALVAWHAVPMVVNMIKSRSARA